MVFKITEGDYKGKWLAVGGTVLCDNEDQARKFEAEYYKEDVKE